MQGATFREKMLTAIERKGYSRRQVARLYRPDAPENGRILLHKYHRENEPATPGAEVRRRLADILDAPELLDDSDEEDEALRRRREMFADLLGRIEDRAQARDLEGLARVFAEAEALA